MFSSSQFSLDLDRNYQYLDLKKYLTSSSLNSATDMTEARRSIISSTTAWGINGPEECARRDKLRISDEKKKQFIAVLPTHPPTGKMSGWSSTGFKESSVPNCPPGCELLLTPEVIYVQPASPQDFERKFLMDMPYRFQVEDKYGKVLYYAADTLEAYNEYPSKLREVGTTIVGPEGGLICEINGTLKKRHEVHVHNDATEFGTISMDDHPRKTKDLIIRDSEGLELFRLVPPSKPTQATIGQYKIFVKDSKEAIGEIKRSPREVLPLTLSVPAPSSYVRLPTIVSVPKTSINYTASAPASTTAISVPIIPSPPAVVAQPAPPPPSNMVPNSNLYNITFPPDLDGNSKLLLVSALLALNHALFSPIDYGVNKKNFMAGVIYNLIVIFICLGMIFIIVALVLAGPPKTV